MVYFFRSYRWYRTSNSITLGVSRGSNHSVSVAKQVISYLSYIKFKYHWNWTINLYLAGDVKSACPLLISIFLFRSIHTSIGNMPMRQNQWFSCIAFLHYASIMPCVALGYITRLNGIWKENSTYMLFVTIKETTTNKKKIKYNMNFFFEVLLLVWFSSM
jgi:pheromone shutdown protein TraB